MKSRIGLPSYWWWTWVIAVRDLVGRRLRESTEQALRDLVESVALFG
jgi:hypothetical protein